MVPCSYYRLPWKVLLSLQVYEVAGLCGQTTFTIILCHHCKMMKYTGKASIRNLIDSVCWFCCTSNWNSDRSMKLFHSFILLTKITFFQTSQEHLKAVSYTSTEIRTFSETVHQNLIAVCDYLLFLFSHSFHSLFSSFLALLPFFPDLLSRSLPVFLAIVCLRLPFLFTKSFCWFYMYMFDNLDD